MRDAADPKWSYVTSRIIIIVVIIITIIVQKSTLWTNKELIAMRKSYTETVQSADIISLISDSWKKLSGRQSARSRTHRASNKGWATLISDLLIIN